MLSKSSMMALRMASKPAGPNFASTLIRATLLAPSTSSFPSTIISRGAASSTPTPLSAEASILAAQRRNRPISPHLSIYNKEHTFFGSSIWERITGLGFTGLLYGYATAYLVAPLMGWHLESASVAAAFGELPMLVKGGLKFFVAWPFTFHLINGIKHLTYDFALGFSKKQIALQGWAWWSVSLVSALGLAFLM